MLLEMIRELVYGAAWTTLPPASWCWPLPAKAIERISPRAPLPTMYTAGYFIVRRLPRLPSTHSIKASSWETARLVTRLEMLFAQFWIVVERQRAPFLTTISTTAEW